MATVHAWFSMETALRLGSAVYRKTDGSSVNVTRMDPSIDSKGKVHHGEIYVGAVIRAEDGGCLHPTSRVRSVPL